ncbi:MAG: hypothetical protein HKN75_02790, partial [Bacteroidia bacterium]|nr:hypothetical protein [Bacteroidia bacterium]
DQYNVHPSTMEALQFYEGAQMASSELEKDSIKVTITAFDSSNKNRVGTLLAKPEVASKDILIGEFSNSVLSEALPVVKNNDQNLVLLKAFRSKLLMHYPQVSLAKPSSANQCRLMADYVQDKYKWSDMYIAFQDVKREKDLAAIFTESLDSVQLFSHSEMSGNENLMSSSDEEIKKLFSMMDSTKHNVIFITSSNEPFVNSFLRRLYTKSKWDITIVGLPTWKKFNSIDTEILNHFNLHIFSTDYIDYKDQSVNKFRKAYIAEYKTDPLYEAYEGYFLVHYLANMYHSFGDKYLEFISDRPDKLFTFEAIVEGGGLENSHFSVLSYKNYEFKKVN